MRHVLRAALAAGILGGGMPVFAQNAVPVFDDSLVVTASADAEKRDEVPAAVTVIGAEEIESRQSTTLAEALATVPGLAVVTAGSPGQQTSVFLRGAESEQTLLLWNGIELNDPFFGGANWQFVGTDGVERVEVARGPFSSLYGSAAMGGVVQVFTGSRQGGTARLEGGEDGYFRTGVAAGYALGTNGRLDATGHVRRGDGELANDFFDAEELVARALWDLRPGTSLGLLVRGNDSETGIPLSGGLPTLRRRVAWREGEVAVPLSAELGSWEVDAQLSQTRFDGEFRDPDDPFGFTSSDTESEALRGRAVATWRQEGGLRVSLGTQADRATVDNRSSFGPQLDGSDQRTWAVFGQASVPLGPARLEVGLRRDDNDVYGTETSLRGGAVVPLGQSVRLRASYGEAFRAPSLGELFFPGSGNPALQPETGEGWEVGLEGGSGPWTWGLAGFENRQENVIDFDPVTFTNVNIDRARSRGVEGEVGLRRGILTLRANGTYLDAEDRTTGEALLRRPRESASLLATLAPGRWSWTATGRYVGERPDFDPVTFLRVENPAFTRFDLAARFHVSDRFSPFARVENLADEQYDEALGSPAPGRTWVGGVAVGF